MNKLRSNAATPVLNNIGDMIRKQLAQNEEVNITEVRRGYMDALRENPAWAKTLGGVLSVREDLVLQEEDLPSIADALNMIELMEQRPLRRFSFCSVLWEGHSHGILIEKDDLNGGGLVYVVTMFSLKNGISNVYRAEFRAARHNPEPFVSLLVPGEWLRFSRENFCQISLLEFMLRCMAGVHGYRFRNFPIKDIQNADVDMLAPPKENRYLVDLCARAYVGKVPCTRAIVPLDLIVPGDFQHALSYPLAELKRLQNFHIDNGEAVTELLLYEKNGRLITDDDYSAYLTYKALLFKKVPAVILGVFDERNIQVIQRGGAELVPPIVVKQGGVGRIVPSSKDPMVELEHRLASLAPAKPSLDDELAKIYVRLGYLLRKRNKREAELHSFMKRYPIILDGHHAKVYSEVTIGAYRADLVFCYEQSDKRIVLVELERDDLSIFNKKNRLRHSVVHAVQQVEDWIDAVRQNSPSMPSWLKGAYVVEGVVIVGRTNTLDQQQKNTLFNLNSNRVVKIITYDDLLQRLGRLIGSLDYALNGR